MSTARRTAKRKTVPIWARAAAAFVAALGSFCLFYHLVFWFLWRFLFGEDVWPWPQWSLWFLVILPTLTALASAVFMVIARFEKRSVWIAAVIGVLSIFGLIRYAGEVWKVMFQLGFKPW
jgi:hypothetical protein